MGKHRWGRGSDVRQLIANEAARLIAEDGFNDFLKAKRKAAERYGVSERDGGFPTNIEIEQALLTHQRLFQSETHPRELLMQRRAAREAMRLFKAFQPRLVGHVLDGLAGRHSAVQLHLFEDTPERVAFHLMDRDIPFEAIDKRFRQLSGAALVVPGFAFFAGEYRIEAAVFSEDGIRAAPASPVDGKPMRRATLDELELLLDEAERISA